MKKVMIVDDEYMLLRGLPKLIDWARLGLTIVKTEQNPLKALDWLAENPVDILLSDMNMPELDGPTFVAKAKKLQPDMELIVISGYADFDYVRAGLQQHAVNYLSKPVDTEELVTALEAALKRIDERQASDHNATLAAQAEMCALVAGTDPGSAHDLLKRLEIVFTNPAAPVRLIAVLNPLPPTDLVDFLQEQAAVPGFFREGQDFIILFQGDDNQLNAFINEAPQPISSTRRPELIGPTVSNMTTLTEAYHTMRGEIARQYFFETNAGLRRLPRPEETETMPTLPGFSELRETLGPLDPVAFKKWLVEQLETLKELNATVAFTRQFAMIVLLVISEKGTASERKPAAINAINQAQTVTKLTEILADIAQRAAQESDRRYSRNVLAMRRLIQERYGEPLTLAEVADELHLNAVYLGQLFKQEVGRSFSQYLNDWRMSIAIDLLRNSGEDVNQIAERVGYQTPSYFYKLFKQQTGMSPREYRAAADNGTAD
ncbi:response regulator transcription factor [Lacticaseibacillus mingshuiensis]|uniref:response regulator transcription factor n=1 Tax=Lacticaseibacillus mingshuiensis TaxID=2799574 RepID=UPI0019518593|nr:response regulator transcription factor [Lacticaseibacillus mingshuiensis]